MSENPGNLQPSRRDIRCADADRNTVAEVLNNAYAEGRITREEHDERISSVWKAKTFGDLEDLTGDLMPRAGAVAQYRTQPSNSGIVVDPAHASQQADNVTSILSTVRREGSWRLHQRTSANVVLGEARFDLRTAIWDGPNAVMNVNVMLGEVKIWAPAGITVRFDVTHIMGETKQKGMPPEDPNDVVLVVKGLVMMGEVTVYGPEHKSIGKRLGLS